MNTEHSHQGLTRSQKRVLQQHRNDARAVLDHAPSVRFLLRILDECRFEEDPFAGNSNTTFYNLGEQEAARKIMRALRAADQNAQIKMLTVAAQERERAASNHEGRSDED